MMHNFGLISRGAGGARRGLRRRENLLLHNIPPLDEPVKGLREDNVGDDDEGQHDTISCLC